MARLASIGRRSFGLLLVVCMAAGMAACSTTPATVTSTSTVPQPHPFRATVEAAAERGVHEQAAVGLVVALQVPGEELLVVPAGWADRDGEVPMTAGAVFDIGSVHKTFKWTALHLLADDGLVDLDALANDYVAEPVLPGVTVRDLMFHSSGLVDLPEVAAFMVDAQTDRTRAFTYDDMLGYLDSSSGEAAGRGPFTAGSIEKFVPGTQVHYSSFGPLIANQIVEAVAGVSAEAFVTERILEPALPDTTFMGTQPDPKRLVLGYADETTINPFFPDAESTRSFSTANGGAMHSTAADLANFFHGLFTPPSSAGTSAEIAVHGESRSGGGIETRAGVLRFDRWPEGLWGHAGFGIRSHTALAVHDEVSDATVVVLTNINTAVDDYAGSEAVMTEIVDAVRSSAGA